MTAPVADWAHDVQAGITDRYGLPVDEEFKVRKILTELFNRAEPYDQPLESYMGNGCWLISVPTPIWDVLKTTDYILLSLNSGHTIRLIPMI